MQSNHIDNDSSGDAWKLTKDFDYWSLKKEIILLSFMVYKRLNVQCTISYAYLALYIYKKHNYNNGKSIMERQVQYDTMIIFIEKWKYQCKDKYSRPICSKSLDNKHIQIHIHIQTYSKGFIRRLKRV